MGKLEGRVTFVVRNSKINQINKIFITFSQAYLGVGSVAEWLGRRFKSGPGFQSRSDLLAIPL